MARVKLNPGDVIELAPQKDDHGNATGMVAVVLSDGGLAQERYKIEARVGENDQPQFNVTTLNTHGVSICQDRATAEQVAVRIAEKHLDHRLTALKVADECSKFVSKRFEAEAAQGKATEHS